MQKKKTNKVKKYIKKINYHLYNSVLNITIIIKHKDKIEVGSKKSNYGLT